MFSSKEVNDTYELVIALRSSSLDIQLIQKTSSSKKEILFLQQNIIFLTDSQDPQKYTQQYLSEIKQFFTQHALTIKQLTGGVIHSIKFILYAPWFTSRIGSASHKENIFITEDFIKEKLKEIKVEEGLKALERRVIKIEANGYTLYDVKKIKYPEVTLTTYVSFISKDIYNSLTTIIKETFPIIKEHSFVTSPLLMLENIRNFLPREDNVVFFNIGGEITEIGVIENDSLSFFVTFPVGIHDFLRIIQNNIKTYDYDLLYQKEILIKSSEQNESFKKLKEKWLGLVIQSLGLFSEHTPNKFIVLTHTKTQSFFTNLLQNHIKQGENEVLKNVRIINFDISGLKGIISYKTPTGENNLDLVLEALI